MRQPASHYDDRYDAYELVGEERADEPVERDRRLPAIVLTLAVMALFAGGLWFAYVQGTKQAVAPASGDAVPLIRADDRPTKIKPDQPGGMPAPDQNNSLYSEKPVRPSSEKLLPPPEQPMPRPAPPPKEAAAPAPTIAMPPAAPAEPATAPPQAAAGAPAPAKPAAKAPAETKPPVQAKPAAQVQPAAAVPSEAAPGGSVQVRLGSLRTPEAAREEWARLKRENADLLGNLKANAVPIDLGDKGIYYRIVAGPFADTAAAERLCAELKRRNRGCILAR